MKLKKIIKILFLLVALATMYEYWNIKGMFTAPLMIGISIITGLLNIALELKDKNYLNALLYLITTLALNLGYFEILSNM